MANEKSKKKAIKRVEKAVRKAVKKGVTEGAVEKAVSNSSLGCLRRGSHGRKRQIAYRRTQGSQHRERSFKENSRSQNGDEAGTNRKEYSLEYSYPRDLEDCITSGRVVETHATD
jgi:hypothetical protein